MIEKKYVMHGVVIVIPRLEWRVSSVPMLLGFVSPHLGLGRNFPPSVASCIRKGFLSSSEALAVRHCQGWGFDWGVLMLCWT